MNAIHFPARPGPRVASWSVLLFASLLACRDAGAPAATPETTASDPADRMLADSSTVVVDATVRHVPIEGGCWALAVGRDDILAASQTYYQPSNLPDDFRQDGLKVRAAVKTRRDAASVCMIGPIVNVIWIQRR